MQKEVRLRFYCRRCDYPAHAEAQIGQLHPADKRYEAVEIESVTDSDDKGGIWYVIRYELLLEYQILDTIDGMGKG